MRARPPVCPHRSTGPPDGSRTVSGVKPARRPRFLPFILTGAVLGFLVGAALSAFGWFEDPDPLVPSNYGPSAGVGYLGFLGALVLGLAGAVLAVLLDRRTDRRTDRHDDPGTDRRDDPRTDRHIDSHGGHHRHHQQCGDYCHRHQWDSRPQLEQRLRRLRRGH